MEARSFNPGTRASRSSAPWIRAMAAGVSPNSSIARRDSAIASSMAAWSESGRCELPPSRGLEAHAHKTSAAATVANRVRSGTMTTSVQRSTMDYY
jgi:hypothetical protein